MDNPWKHIPLSDYERHMSAPSVGQTDVLKQILREQLTEYPSSEVTIFGIGAGDGLDAVDPAVTKIVTGIDINADYLQQCKHRHGRRGFALRLVEADITADTFAADPSELIIANLFLEYIGRQKFLSALQCCAKAGSVVSITLQKNNGETFVAQTNIPSLSGLNHFHMDVTSDDIIATMNEAGGRLIATKRYPLPGRKTFVRCDFRLP